MESQFTRYLRVYVVRGRTAEDALVVAKQHKRHLARNGYSRAQLEPPPIPVELGRPDHLAFNTNPNAPSSRKRKTRWESGGLHPFV